MIIWKQNAERSHAGQVRNLERACEDILASAARVRPVSSVNFAWAFIKMGKNLSTAKLRLAKNSFYVDWCVSTFYWKMLSCISSSTEPPDYDQSGVISYISIESFRQRITSFVDNLNACIRWMTLFDFMQSFLPSFLPFFLSQSLSTNRGRLFFIHLPHVIA